MRSRICFSTLLVAASAAHVTAQGLVYELGQNAQFGDDFGRAVAGAGDVDGDGFPDVVVGAPFAGSGGEVYTFSGRTGQLIWTETAENSGDALGWAVDGIGDITGDGRSEVIVSAPLFDFFSPNGGKVYVLSGATGATVFSAQVNQSAAQLGSVVRGLGDITGDGWPDFGFGSQYYDNGGLSDCGRLDVYAGGPGIPNLFVRYGSEDFAFYGASFDVVRATGSQATSRLIVGAFGVDGVGVDRGEATLMDGFGLPISFFAGGTNGASLGYQVAGLGDVDADGWEDYAISSPYTDILFVGTDAGTVTVYSGATTSPLFTVNGPTSDAYYGQSLAGFGDLDGDGRDDVLIGAPNHDSPATDGGIVIVASGANGSTLASWTGGSNDHAGRSVSSAGDLNLDGVNDIVWGANDAPFGAGRAYVHLSRLPVPTVYCAAKPNSLACIPQIAWSGAPSKSIADSFMIDASNVLNNKNGLLFWGLATANLPFQGGTLCVQPPLKRTAVQNSGGNAPPDDCSGQYTFHFSHAYMAAQAIPAGTSIAAQYWSRDPAASFGVGLTDAVSFTVVD